MKSIFVRVKRFLKKLLFRFGLLPVRKSPGAINWGVIGLGYMAETMSTTIDFSETGVVHAVASRSTDKAKSFAKRHGNAKYYGDYDSMISDDDLKLDIIYIATPLNTHCEIIEKCLTMGHNVICEKPIVFSKQKLLNLISLAEENNCFLMEAMWMKCLPTFKQARDLIENGDIGRLKYIRAELNKLEVYKTNSHSMNSGVLRDFGVYALTFVTSYIGGQPDEVSSRSIQNDHGVDTNWIIHGSKSDIQFSVNLSSNFAGINKAIIIGSEGSLVWDTPFNRTNRLFHYDKSGQVISVYEYEYTNEGFEYQVEEVFKCIEKSRMQSEIVPLADSVEVIQWVEDLLKSDSW